MTTADKVRDRNASAWLIPNDGSRTNHALRADMRRYDPQDEVDLVIVGAGAGGSVLAQRLARAGWSIVVLDSGPFWDPDADWVSDERGAHTLYWTEPRQIGGADPVPFGSNNSGRGVGGSMIHYAGYTPRFHPSDFRTHTQDGVGADWPITYQDLKPHYEAIEAELPVAGQDWPWGDPHRYPQHAHPVGGNGDIFLRGASALGIEARVGPVAISNGRFGNRPHCIYRGFCLQGCKVNAKASPLITHIPDALAHGAEIRPDSHVTRVLVDDDTGRATGVTYLHAGLRAPPAGAGRGRGRVQHRDAATAPALGDGPLPGRSGQRPRQPRPLPHGPRRPPDRRPLRDRGPDVQGPAPRSQLRGVLRDQPIRAVQARLVHPDRQPAAHHLGRTRCRPRPLGRGAPRVHARLHPLGHPRRAVRVPSPIRQPGHPRGREGPPRPTRRPLRLHPVRQRQSPTRGCATVHGRHPASRRAPKKS